jgi:hypothetical protein
VQSHTVRFPNRGYAREGNAITGIGGWKYDPCGSTPLLEFLDAVDDTDVDSQCDDWGEPNIGGPFAQVGISIIRAGRASKARDQDFGAPQRALAHVAPVFICFQSQNAATTKRATEMTKENRRIGLRAAQRHSSVFLTFCEFLRLLFCIGGSVNDGTTNRRNCTANNRGKR